MAVLDENRVAFVEKRSDPGPYSVRRSIAIITGVSLSFWALLGFAIYELL